MKKKSDSSDKILRFRGSERHIHWAISIPFMVCYFTALTLVIFYNPDPERPYRFIFSWIHRISGVLFITLPMIVMFRSRGDFKVYFYNIKQAWAWGLSDFKFLLLLGVAAVNKRIKLPDQGKFNAAEKINFMVLMSTYPFYMITGILIWVTDGALLAWLVHFAMAIAATPLMCGHIFMATINPESRVAFSGMITGYVDRKYVKHHHAAWYKEQFEDGGDSDEASSQKDES